MSRYGKMDVSFHVQCFYAQYFSTLGFLNIQVFVVQLFDVQSFRSMFSHLTLSHLMLNISKFGHSMSNCMTFRRWISLSIFVLSTISLATLSPSSLFTPAPPSFSTFSLPSLSPPLSYQSISLSTPFSRTHTHACILPPPPLTLSPTLPPFFSIYPPSQSFSHLVSMK